MPELTHSEQLIQWGFEVWSTIEGAPPEFLSAIGGLETLPPDFANARYFLEGQAITDKGLAVLYSPFFVAAPTDIIALDGRLLNYFKVMWLPKIGLSFQYLKNVILTVPDDVALGIGYGHDKFVRIYNEVIEEIDAAIYRAQAAGIPSISETEYLPAYVAVPALVVADIVHLYVDLDSVVVDARASESASIPVGVIEAFVAEALATAPKPDRPSGITFAAIAFAGLGAAAIFATVMSVKGK